VVSKWLLAVLPEPAEYFPLRRGAFGTQRPQNWREQTPLAAFVSQVYLPSSISVALVSRSRWPAAMFNPESPAEKAKVDDHVPTGKVLHQETIAHIKEETEAQLGRLSEKKVLLKTDLHVVPILFLLFLCAFIDRINIGNARIQGLEPDLNMQGSDYNIALFTFFILYILLEVPSNIILKKMRPSVFLSSIMLGWGIVTVCQGLTESFAGLVVCRVLIGALEAGFFPGCIYLISMFYKRHELQWRVNLFFSASIIAGAFSGLLAYAIAHMDGIGGYGGWRWIFILEGLATIAIAIASYWLVPDWPETAKFYTEDEREFWISRLALDNEDTHMSRWDKHTTRRVFGDLKIYLGYVLILTFDANGLSNRDPLLQYPNVHGNCHHWLRRFFLYSYHPKAARLDLNPRPSHVDSDLPCCYLPRA
jgi:MFS family permease